MRLGENTVPFEQLVKLDRFSSERTTRWLLGSFRVPDNERWRITSWKIVLSAGAQPAHHLRARVGMYAGTYYWERPLFMVHDPFAGSAEAQLLERISRLEILYATQSLPEIVYDSGTLGECRIEVPQGEVTMEAEAVLTGKRILSFPR